VVDPARVRQARLAAGLSLADVAGNDVSRTMIHFIEHGRARPSERVLELIAERTGKPVSYFVVPTAEGQPVSTDESLSRQLSAAAGRARRFATAGRLTRSEREAVKLVEVTLRQAAALIKLLESRAG
jgi:transcriptional regulator with XRE-family HTH domain